MKRTSILLLAILLFFGFACSSRQLAEESKSLYPYLEAEALLALTQNPDPQIRIIDLRSPEAYARGHIPTAVNMPSGEIMTRLKELPRSQYLIFYCESGGRAHMVIEQLNNKGYIRMLNWGGYSRWPHAASSAIQPSEF
ncbi:MAG: rhodanese-like domain-containing protein [Candidatus Neomarinimicrobiota bacterium]